MKNERMNQCRHTCGHSLTNYYQYRRDISTKFSRNSEADASEFIEN